MCHFLEKQSPLGRVVERSLSSILKVDSRSFGQYVKKRFSGTEKRKASCFEVKT